MTYNPATGGTAAISRATAITKTNNTGSVIPKATPAKVTSTGIALVDPSIEADIDGLAGLTKVAVANGGDVEVIAAGTIEDISTSASVGDTMYVSKSGGIINTKPSIGVAGFVANDWIVRVGVIAKNNSNPSLKDLIVNLQFIGTL